MREPLSPTTLHILANKALNRLCTRDCVDWAMSMVMKGH